MQSSLKARFACLGPIQAVVAVPSGSPAAFVLRLPKTRVAPKTVDAVLSLVRRGMSMLKAKRSIEELLMNGRAFIELSMVESREALVTELAAASISAAAIANDPAPVEEAYAPTP